MSELTSVQKFKVCSLAGKAYQAWPGREHHERTVGSGKNGLTTWRHDEQERSIGVRSLRHCSDADYDTLIAHFHRLRMVYLQDAAIEQHAFSP